MRRLFSLALLWAIFLVSVNIHADNLIILTTNDTHSQIDPLDNGKGGAARRKGAIDSVRRINGNVLLVDAGDAVQGTMYFTIYKGEVEYSLMDKLGYDVAVLGNHDFDNGVEALAANLKDSHIAWLTANYDLSGAPGLDSVFVPSIIKEYSGKKVGVFGINLVPEGMIAKGNYDGVVYLDAIATAQKSADSLRAAGADYVIAVTHIGYDGNIEPNDCMLATATSGIDLIIGGHSHSFIDPESNMTERFHWKHLNAEGDTVAVIQTGSRGENIGEIILNLENGKMQYGLIPIDSSFDSNLDPETVAFIDSYRQAVDSIMSVAIGTTARKLGKEDAGLMNFLGDFVAWQGKKIAGCDIDFSLINAGGVRRELPEGEISKGMLIDMLPFNNKVVVLDISGADLLDAIYGVIRRGGFDGTNTGTAVIFDPDTKLPVTATLNGRAIEPDRIYTMATIDYLANGGDYMTSLTRATEKARSSNVLYDDLIEYVSSEWAGKPIDAEPQRRIVPLF